MHEQSESKGGGLEGLFRNVFGRKTPQAGQTLPPKFPFERDSYGDMDEAVRAAELRSRLTDENNHSAPGPRPFGLLDLLRLLK